MSAEIEGHTHRAYDGALSALHVRTVEMGVQVLRQVREAATAFTDWDEAHARRLLEREPSINAFERAIADEALAIIARRQPVATDLRLILALTRVAAELERAGDEAKKIAYAVTGRSGRTARRPGAGTSRDARHLAQLAGDLLHLSLEAFDRLDAARAREVVARDKELDEEYANGMRRLLTRAAEDVRFFGVALDSAFVLKSLERIGDHARNIARLVLHLGRSETAGESEASSGLSD